MFSFFVLVFLLNAALFWGGEEFHSSKTTLINRSGDHQMEIG